MLRQLALKQLTRAVVKGSAPSTAAKYSLPIAQTRFINNLADEKLTIPTDKEQQGGRRKEEIDAEAVGKVAFNRDPIIPADERGTKEHPILVSRCFWLVYYLFFIFLLRMPQLLLALLHRSAKMFVFVLFLLLRSFPP